MASAEALIKVDRKLLVDAGVRYTQVQHELPTNREIVTKALEFFVNNFELAEAKGK